MFGWRKKAKKVCSERDARFFLLLCFGRAPVHGGELRRRMNASPFGVCKSLLRSSEFGRNMLEPLALKKCPLWRPYSANDQKLLAYGLKNHFDMETVQPADTWLATLQLLASNSRFLQIFDAAETGYSAPWLQEKLDSVANFKPREIVGEIEEITEKNIRGFALDRQDPALPLTLDFYVNGAFIGQSTPAGPRPDLQEKYGGNGKFAFNHTFTVPDHLQHYEQLVVTAFDHESAQPACAPKEFAPIKARHQTDIARLADELALLRHSSISDAASVVSQLDRIEAALPQIARAASYPLGDYAAFKAAYPVGPAPTHPDEIDSGVVLCFLDNRADEAAAGSVSRSALADADADYVLFVSKGAAISPHAVAWIRYAAAQNPDAILIYADYDIQEGDAYAPCCRGKFDVELLLQDPSYAAAYAVRQEFAQKLGDGPAADLELWLHVLGAHGPSAFAHVPKILWHMQRQPLPPVSETSATVAAYFNHHNIAAISGPHQDRYGGALKNKISIEWPIDESLPKLAIIIPTRDQLNLLRDCVESLQATLSYPDATEIIIVNNGSQDPELLAWLEKCAAALSFTVIKSDTPFNWSELNNIAAGKTDAEYLLFLNDDTKALDIGWDQTLRGYLARQDVGAVGARLLYGDGSIQHGGVTINQLKTVASDAIVHEAQGQSPSVGDYMNRSQLCHTSSAVTGAFLACKRADFDRLKGFDAKNFAVTFNDIDFCLRLNELGKKIVYVSAITFMHFESKTRGYDHMSCEKASRVNSEHKIMIQKWKKSYPIDVWYAPAFLHSGEPYRRLAAPNRTPE